MGTFPLSYMQAWLSPEIKKAPARRARAIVLVAPPVRDTKNPSIDDSYEWLLLV